MTQHNNDGQQPFVDADDTHDVDAPHEEVENHEGPRTQGEKVAEDLKRFATDAAYAAAGFAGLLGDKAREFYDEQRQQYTEAHPESENDPEARQFLNQIRDRVNGFFEELSRNYKDLADRGRSQHSRAGESAFDAGEPAADVDDVVVEEEVFVTEPVADDFEFTPETDQTGPDGDIGDPEPRRGDLP